MKNPRKRRPFVLLVAAGLCIAVAGCGDGGTATELEGGSGSGSGSGSASGSASGVAAVDLPCAPVGEELEADADTTVEVDLAEYAFEPSEIEVAAGVVTFAATNGGAEAHELAFLPGGGAVPFTDDGVADEDALAEAGAFELEAFGPGQTCNATYELQAGVYTVFCIVAAEDGETHYEKGMQGTLTVG